VVSTPRPRALVVEDDRKTADWLSLYLSHAGYEVAACATGTDALSQARTWTPDVVLLDVMLPGGSGFEVCRALRRESRVPILLITARADEADRLHGFDCGADDYVTKPFSPREVVARVKAVLRRTRDDADAPIVSAGWSLDPLAHELRAGEALVRLTAVESRLLAVFLRAPGRVFTRPELVQRLFGEDYAGQERTVDAHVKNLRRKMEAADAASAIETVHGSGYRLARTTGAA
jgi:DNA-binding response OmpR family regulator